MTTTPLTIPLASIALLSKNLPTPRLLAILINIHDILSCCKHTKLALWDLIRDFIIFRFSPSFIPLNIPRKNLQFHFLTGTNSHPIFPLFLAWRPFVIDWTRQLLCALYLFLSGLNFLLLPRVKPLELLRASILFSKSRTLFSNPCTGIPKNLLNFSNLLSYKFAIDSTPSKHSTESPTDKLSSFLLATASIPLELFVMFSGNSAEQPSKKSIQSLLPPRARRKNKWAITQDDFYLKLKKNKNHNFNSLLLWLKC